MTYIWLTRKNAADRVQEHLLREEEQESDEEKAHRGGERSTNERQNNMNMTREKRGPKSRGEEPPMGAALELPQEDVRSEQRESTTRWCLRGMSQFRFLDDTSR